ncbi:dipeptidase [Sphingomonas daechungensis]|uniref:Dipeptidase n=1 Tax=Sphingomonas daechungensis TaxID=1176646 RepID=A0ABX6T368_9SPHN|nr:dipeptidase [Sphingomonas daechungensis]QNP43874.1 dipeptidase [Sphingomonas daechungensis]
MSRTTRALTAAAALLIATPALSQTIDPAVQKRIDRILKQTPLIDGHNDVPEQVRENWKFSVEGLASGSDKRQPNPMMTDMERLHQGRVGGQFWSVYIDASVHGDEAIRQTLEQIDIVTRLVEAYPNDLELASTADDFVRIHRKGKIASVMGVEGGHQIGGSMAALRQYYRLGVRYMTLTHFATNEWADSATDDPKYGGLSPFGVEVVKEMNRIGMLVDLAHVSPDTMKDAIAASKAPVIFSHSNARALEDHPRNVPDEVLALLPSNGGVVMVNFYTGYLSEPFRQWNANRAAEEARFKSLFTGQPDKRNAAMDAWDKANPPPKAEIGIIADHIEHIVKVAGHDHVGLGGDLDGIPYDQSPPGMNSVAGYPLIFAELIRRGWNDKDLAKLAGGNILRVLRQAEAVSASMKDVPPSLATLPPAAAAAKSD